MDSAHQAKKLCKVDSSLLKQHQGGLPSILWLLEKTCGKISISDIWQGLEFVLIY